MVSTQQEVNKIPPVNLLSINTWLDELLKALLYKEKEYGKQERANSKRET